MANGDVQLQISDQYLKQFDRSIGVAGMQKLQNFESLQKLGYNGILSHIKSDFHGLVDFKTQMTKYSSVSHTLRIAWALIQAMVPTNISILVKLTTIPGLGSVGKEFLSIHNFAKVFSLVAGDLRSPSAVSAKASVYANQSIQANVVDDFSNQTSIGGGGGGNLTSLGNTSMINGILVVGTPTPTNNTINYNGTNIVWAPSGGGTPLTSLDCGTY